MDVTWRYSNRHDEVLKRRRECREEWLVLTISNFNKSVMTIFIVGGLICSSFMKILILYRNDSF